MISDMLLISQKRVQKYKHFSNWQNIFFIDTSFAHATYCYIVYMPNKIFYGRDCSQGQKDADEMAETVVFHLDECIIFFTSRVAMASLCSSLSAQKI